MKCNSCGRELDLEKWHYCPGCGAGLCDEKILNWMDTFFRSKKSIISLFIILLIGISYFGINSYLSNKEVAIKNRELKDFTSKQNVVSTEWLPEEKIVSLLYMNGGKLGKLKIASQSYSNIKIEVGVDGITETKTKTISIKPETKEIELRADISTEGIQKLRYDSQTGKMFLRVYEERNGEEKLILQDDSSVFFDALNEIIWKENGIDNTKEVLRLADKDDPMIDELIRNAVKYVKKNGGTEDVILGSAGDEKEIKAEVKAIFEALMKDYEIRYVFAPFSYNGKNIQKIKSPADVLKTQSGICIDLSLLMVAAFENIGLNPVMIFLDDHVWPGVEVGYGTGKYIFIESTALTSTPQNAMNIADKNWDYLQRKDVGRNYNLMRVVDIRANGIMPINF